jgi:hypothetical protein
VQLGDERFERPAGFDVLAYLTYTMKLLPRKYPVEVFVHAPLEQVQFELPADTFLLEPQAGGVLMRGRTDDLKWMAQNLSRISYPFIIYQPDDLRAVLRQHALQLVAMTEKQNGASS